DGGWWRDLQNRTEVACFDGADNRILACGWPLRDGDVRLHDGFGYDSLSRYSRNRFIVGFDIGLRFRLVERSPMTFFRKSCCLSSCLSSMVSAHCFNQSGTVSIVVDFDIDINIKI